MKGGEYRDLVASYVDANFSTRGLLVYTEVSLGKTIIGKNRKIDLLLLRPSDQQALAIECKYQSVSGTADEKIPYALQDLEAMWIPGCLCYGGTGWSSGVLHTLEGSRLAVRCEPKAGQLSRTRDTLELDHVLAAVFGLWEHVVPDTRLFSGKGTLIPGPHKARPREVESDHEDGASGGSA